MTHGTMRGRLIRGHRPTLTPILSGTNTPSSAAALLGVICSVSIRTQRGEGGGAGMAAELAGGSLYIVLDELVRVRQTVRRTRCSQ